MGFLGGSVGKESTCNAGDLSLIPGKEDLLDKEMATHLSVLAWEILGQKNLVGISRWGPKESDMT